MGRSLAATAHAFVTESTYSDRRMAKPKLSSMKIVLIQGHPDPGGGHLCNGLADAYVAGATSWVTRCASSTSRSCHFRCCARRRNSSTAPCRASVIDAQQAIGWAEHLVFVYPLWLGGMPALLKGFLEQVARPGFAFDMKPGLRARKGLRGKSARVIVTMGMLGRRLPLVLRRAGLEKPAEEHSVIRRHQTDARDFDRFGRDDERAKPGEMAHEGARARNRRAVRELASTAPEHWKQASRRIIVGE